jgi:exosome complex exonuclease RRP6
VSSKKHADSTVLLMFARPIPEEMFFYARADTHFLLFIYDNMRNELIDMTKPEIPEENRIELVLQKSKETSLFRYERQIYHADSGKGPGGWYTLLVKTPALFNNEQFAVFRAIHAWRDKIARIDDDSTAFVMPNHVIFTIAKLLPNDMVALLGVAHPISHSVKSRAGELLALIKSAKASGKEGPSMMDVLRPNSVGAIAKANIPSVATKNVAPANTLVAVVDEGQLRSEESSFWGGAFGSSIWDAPAAKSEDMRLAVPLPALSSKIFEASPFSTQPSSSPLTDRSRPQVKSPANSQPAEPRSKPEDEAFVLKRGGKRKSEAISESEENAGEYDISLNDPGNELGEDEDYIPGESKVGTNKATKKSERKAAKRAAKKARAEEQEKALAERLQQEELEIHGEAADLQRIDDDEPFDYSKAESVLHGKRNGGEREGGKKRKKPFDPYAKSADAPKGMRRAQTERAGKSHTFKS